MAAGALAAGLAGLVAVAGAQTSAPPISLVSLAPAGVIQAGLPYVASLEVDSTGRVAVQAMTVAVRDDGGGNRDFPGSLAATIDGTLLYTSGSRSFAGGTYTEFGSYEVSNVWHRLASQTLTVVAPSSGDPNPPPVGIPGNWISTLNDGPVYINGAAADTVSDLLAWRGGPDGPAPTTLFGPDNPTGKDEEDDCYNPGNVSLSGSFVDLQLTKAPAGPSDGCASPDDQYYGAYITSDHIETPGGDTTSFRQQYGAFEAEVYLPPAPDGEIADWPAFWLNGTGTWPTTGEIDIFEGLSGHGAYHVHYGARGTNLSAGAQVTVGPGWHTFGAAWAPVPGSPFTAYTVTYYYDGVAVGSTDEPTTAGELISAPMNMIFDISDMVRNPAGERVVNAPLRIAYARAWTRAPATHPG